MIKKLRPAPIAGEMLALARRMQLPLRSFPIIVLLNIAWIGFEGLGIAMLLPVMELMQNGGDITSDRLTGKHWEILREAADLISIELTLGFLLAVAFGFIVLRQAVKFLTTLYNNTVARRTADRVRRRAFTAFLRSRTEVQDQIRVGEFANEISVELERALSSIFSAVRAFATCAHILLFVAGLAFLSAGMTALSIGVFLVLVFLLRRIFKLVRHTGSRVTEANNALAGFLVERMPKSRLIRLSGMEKAESRAFGKMSGTQAREEFRHRVAILKTALLPEPVMIGFALSVLYVGYRVFGLELQILGLFVIVIIRLLPVLVSAVNDYNSVVGKWPSVRKIDDRLRRTLASREVRGGDTVFERLDNAIEYRNVSFHYPGGAEGSGTAVPALEDVSVMLPAHKMSALVGPSGAGKSTFVDLLPRLRDPMHGEILFDGVPISNLTMASLRAGIAFVPQEPQIFDNSASDHIRYGKENATDDEVREAARLAGALDFIEALPDGFDTPLGDSGNRLSGGQRQRLDIARALVRHAPILVLDEPTSALDADAESAFRDALRTLRHETDLTIIVIAHRLSTIADAENIVVLREGRVEAVGTHGKLLQDNGWYAGAYRQQVAAHDAAHDAADIATGSRERSRAAEA